MKSKSILVVDQTRGWRLGLKNMLGYENTKWWGSPRWWIQTLLWGLIINGLLVLLLFLMPFITEIFDGVEQSELANLPDGVSAFFSLAGFVLPIGVVILVQGSITQEKELGTIEWILSKPISRTAFFLSKLLSQTFGILITMVIFQSLIALMINWIHDSSSIFWQAYFKGTAILALDLFFYITLTLMVEVLSNSRGIVLGISLGSALGGAILVNLFPGLGLITPFALPSVIGAVATNTLPPGFPLWLPLTGTAVASVIFLFTSIWQINHKEI